MASSTQIISCMYHLILHQMILLVCSDPSLTIWPQWPDGIIWGTLCVSNTTSCRSYAHFVLNVKPSSTPLALIRGGGHFSLDNGTWQSGKEAIFEGHLILENTTQVWTWNWDAMLDRSKGKSAPKTICVSVWFEDTSIENSTVNAYLGCFHLNETYVSTNSVPTYMPEIHSYRFFQERDDYDVVEYSRLLFGNWTVACSAFLKLCRIMGHVAVDGAVAPTVVSELSGKGEYSFDFGATFYTSGQLNFLSTFDDPTQSYPAVSQRYHWGLDIIFPGYDPADPSTKPDIEEVCYRIWFDDPCQQELKVPVSMDIDQPPWPSGYSKNATVRCWSIQTVLELP